MAHSRRAKVKDPAKAFISTWKTDNLSTGSSNNNQVRLPLDSTGTYTFTVNWGDGSSNVITTWNQAEATHTYAAIGTYTITITGFIKGWFFYETGDKLKLISITQWGCLRFLNGLIVSNVSVGTFKNCTNLVLSSVSDTPNFKGVTKLSYMFRNTSFSTVNNINKWDVSKIENTVQMFYFNTNFNQNIGNWNVGNLRDPSFMFYCYLAGGVTLAAGSFNNGGDPSIGNWDTRNFTNTISVFFNQTSFNQDLGGWDMSSNTNMGSMFRCQNVVGTFNNGGTDTIKNWNTSNVTKMNSVFLGQTSFNQPIGSWNTSNVDDMSFMFNVSNFAGIFNQDLSNWNTSKVTTMVSMFYNQRSFNQNIGNWDVSKVTIFSSMFVAYGGSTASTITGVFNNGGSNSIKNWNTSSATDMSFMFYNQPNFNHEIGLWNVGNVTNMSNMLGIIAGQNSPTVYGAFNNAGSDSIKNWNTSKVTNMQALFYVQPSFNQEIGTWDVSKVTDFSIMFSCYAADPGAHPGAFNNGGSTSISTWNTGSALTMRGMFFSQYAFNKTINSWDTSKVTNMNRMMASTPGYDLPLNNLNVSLVTDFGNFMENRTFNDYSAANYDALLIGWASRPVKPNISINFNTIKRTAASTAARLVLTSAPNNWTIVDGGI